MRIEIDRLAIALHGVSAEQAEATASLIEGELIRRLASLPLHVHDRIAHAEVTLGRIETGGALDPAGLAALIVDRLIATLATGAREAS